MITAPDVVACVLDLVAMKSSPIEYSQGRRAHALFLDIVKASDPILATQLHADAPFKPWTVTPLTIQTKQIQHGAGYRLRVALLQSGLYLPFARTFLDQPLREIRLDQAIFTLRAIHTTPVNSPWAGVSTWKTLIDNARPTNEISLHFGAPTTFALSGNQWSKNRSWILPDGETVFKSLLKRWNAFSPQPIDLGLLANVDILPKQFDLHTEMLVLKNQQVGFMGKVTYKLDGAEADRRLLAMLADAALYLGVGAKTTQGMGLVRRIL